MKLFTQFIIALSLAFGFLNSPLSAQANEPSSAQENPRSPLEIRADEVIALINGELEPEDVFTQGFLNVVSAERFKSITQQLTSQFGRAIAVEELAPPYATRASLAIRMDEAIAKGGIAIDPANENRVSELLFQSFDPISDSVANIEADLRALNGEVSWWFGPLGKESTALTSFEPDQPMPIGSTFKLYVLATLAREVSQGKYAWSDTVTLGRNRSFPSGMMQDWPSDAPVTLHTLASLMISISDNTATDTLIDTLGRDAVLQTLIESEHSQPHLNDPFLKTREMFLLKSGPEGRLRTYLGAGADLRRQILDGIEDIAVPVGQVETAFSGPPIALDVEWLASANDIAALMRYMRAVADPEAFEIMAINPSTSKDTEGEWAYVGYKGGSEPGVLNLSWLLEDGDGRDHALILSWRNDDQRFDPTALELIAQRLLSLNR